MDLANCEMQAKLTENGRDDARLIGKAFQALGIPVGEILASEYCRTMETARLAFGRAEPADVLLHPAYQPVPGARRLPAYAERKRAMEQLLSTQPRPGTNTVLITHGENLRDAFGFEGATGEALVLRPDGQGGFTLVSRVLPRAWLAERR